MKSAKPLLLIAIASSCVILLHRYVSSNTIAESISPTEFALNIVTLGDKSVRLIGPVAPVAETGSGLVFKARVDTGASRCSLHVEEWEIDDADTVMSANVGKTIRFRLVNRRGESQWLTRQIAEVDLVRTSEDEEMRYLVPLSLSHQGVEREVLVSLNDRSKMSYAMLLGRNYLAGEFVVDVSRDNVDGNLFAGNP
ncbi:putative ATP-dependent zinc protease [Bythopirellula polymerisocia]|uniref:Retropepsin-like aspartic endopeptidase domain-containing protein n=1 Tax=Bythopirellula polymerisocia TaxID=2528003 RepID=A0A5C6D2P3_9BACT|nr:RimK/LysX family protein [Bythopirellula polymerisocia]TWU30395.1 hypothetical protein Pla144_11810 [Bythopirellula polymerisocia]